MKNTLLVFALSLGLMSATSSSAATLCFTDIFGYQYEISATKTGPMFWDMTGTVNIGGGLIWDCEGYWDRFNQVFYLDVMNPSPDGCTGYVDGFEITSTSWSPGSISANWNSYCSFGSVASGTMSLTYVGGGCPFRMSSEGTPVGPVLSNPVAFNPINLVIEETRSLDEILVETELFVSRNGEGFTFSTNAPADELLIYNHAGQLVTSMSANGTMLYWDGRTSGGAASNSGMYVAVLRNGEETVTTKFIK